MGFAGLDRSINSTKTSPEKAKASDAKDAEKEASQPTLPKHLLVQFEMYPDKKSGPVVFFGTVNPDLLKTDKQRYLRVGHYAKWTYLFALDRQWVSDPKTDFYFLSTLKTQKDIAERSQGVFYVSGQIPLLISYPKRFPFGEKEISRVIGSAPMPYGQYLKIFTEADEFNSRLRSEADWTEMRKGIVKDLSCSTDPRLAEAYGNF